MGVTREGVEATLTSKLQPTYLVCVFSFSSLICLQLFIFSLFVGGFVRFWFCCSYSCCGKWNYTLSRSLWWIKLGVAWVVAPGLILEFFFMWFCENHVRAMSVDIFCKAVSAFARCFIFLWSVSCRCLREGLCLCFSTFAIHYSFRALLPISLGRAQPQRFDQVFWKLQEYVWLRLCFPNFHAVLGTCMLRCCLCGWSSGNLSRDSARHHLCVQLWIFLFEMLEGVINSLVLSFIVVVERDHWIRSILIKLLCWLTLR